MLYATVLGTNQTAYFPQVPTFGCVRYLSIRNIFGGYHFARAG